MMMQKTVISVMATLLAALSAACGANEGILRSGKANEGSPNTAASRPQIEDELAAMRTAGFNFIYVIRRKDGGKIDAEDRSVIRMNTGEANRRVSADDDRAFVIGSNPPLPPKNMTAIYERFAVENYSPPAANTNSNSNAAK